MDDEELDEEALSVGEALGKYAAYREAQAAYDAGEIELWLEFNRPKSLGDWMEWEIRYGTIDEFKKRWSSGND